MSWIEDRLGQRKRLKEHRQIIAEGAESLFESLWQEIVGNVKEAAEKGLQVGTNGAGYERIVWESMTPRPGQRSANRKEVKITLRKEREAVSISETTPLSEPYDFQITVDDNGVVSLAFNGAKWSIQKAAQFILDRFLFPDVQIHEPKL